MLRGTLTTTEESSIYLALITLDKEIESKFLGIFGLNKAPLNLTMKHIWPSKVPCGAPPGSFLCVVVYPLYSRTRPLSVKKDIKSLNNHGGHFMENKSSIRILWSTLLNALLMSTNAAVTATGLVLSREEYIKFKKFMR